jgi:protein tyrosine phosphatase
MIWEQNTRGIIMLNRLMENDRPKCEMYYPNTDEEDGELKLEFGKFRLNYSSERLFQDFAIRTVECENLEQKQSREVYHVHFTKWPDFGEPDTPDSFLKLLDECEMLGLFDPSQNGPSVVHCSAGVGRSGTFILVDSMIQLVRLKIIYEKSFPLVQN